MAGKFNPEPPVDPRVEAIEKRGMELFPTKAKQRERWIADQKSAMAKISQRRRGVPASMGDEVRALAEKNSPATTTGSSLSLWRRRPRRLR